MYRIFEHGQVVLSGFRCMYAIHEASLQSHESIIALIRSSSTSTEIRNYLVANPIIIQDPRSYKITRSYTKNPVSNTNSYIYRYLGNERFR